MTDKFEIFEKFVDKEIEEHKFFFEEKLSMLSSEEQKMYYGTQYIFMTSKVLEHYSILLAEVERDNNFTLSHEEVVDFLNVLKRKLNFNFFYQKTEYRNNYRYVLFWEEQLPRSLKDLPESDVISYCESLIVDV